MIEKPNDSRRRLPAKVVWAQYVGIIPLFMLALHGFSCLHDMESHSFPEFYKAFIAGAGMIEDLSLAYIATTLLVSTAYSVAIVLPAIGVFFGLDDPVIAVTFSVFAVCVVYDFINSLDFSATKFGVGLFTGTLVKEKFKGLKSDGGSK